MPDFVLSEEPVPIAIVCHDAGAANIVFSWLRELANGRPEVLCEYRIFVDGPAQKLLMSYGALRVCLAKSMHSALQGANLLIAGTGWGSYLEYDAVWKAKKLGIRTVSVIDHWVNYRARFVRNGQEILPDEMWVSDEYAKNIAAQEFPGHLVKQKPNLYLDELVTQVRSRGGYEHPCGGHLLYLLEPIRMAWRQGGEMGEFEALDYFLSNLVRLGLNEVKVVRLRPHPSDSVGKYDRWSSVLGGVTVEVDEKSSLADSIAWANVVVGCQTFAMVIALSAGKRVISSIPPWAPPCALPHEGIEKMAVLLA
jgi:hypothetical protein